MVRRVPVVQMKTICCYVSLKIWKIYYVALGIGVTVTELTGPTVGELFFPPTVVEGMLIKMWILWMLEVEVDVGEPRPREREGGREGGLIHRRAGRVGGKRDECRRGNLPYCILPYPTLPDCTA